MNGIMIEFHDTGMDKPIWFTIIFNIWWHWNSGISALSTQWKLLGCRTWSLSFTTCWLHCSSTLVSHSLCTYNKSCIPCSYFMLLEPALNNVLSCSQAEFAFHSGVISGAWGTFSQILINHWPAYNQILKFVCLYLRSLRLTKMIYRSWNLSQCVGK